MTQLSAGKPWVIAVGLLALGLAGCPRQDFDFGGIKGGSGGSGGNAGASGGDNQLCGSRGLRQCDEGLYCSYPGDASCGETDKPGTCQPTPEACDLIYAPVCGCDGQTYGNDCEAASAGVSIRYDGECEPSGGGKTCGGLLGGRCAADEYCNYPPDAMCGIADAPGVCTPKPEACADIYQPVCGCDGKTYGNACEAASAGISVATRGECSQNGGDSCGGLLGGSCEDGEFCDYPIDAICGAADATGVCRTKPDACTLQYDPVCGCDGNTYGNACAAAAEGVSVASLGECGSTGGTTCGVRGAAECGDTEYCKYPDGSQCGAADEPGTCAPKPDVCTLELKEVCGCDGNTYGNDCLAAAGGTSVAHEGPCEGAGQECGGIAGLACADDQYCNYPLEAQCGAADQLGVCAEIPSVCTREYRPVCGCDDTTYGNPCMAAAAGVSIAREGECDGGSSGNVCGGLTGAGCPRGEYCDYPLEAQCGAADQTGTCAPMPEACTEEYDPVCGCDDKTYGNACAAASAGVSVASEGECN